MHPNPRKNWYLQKQEKDREALNQLESEYQQRIKELEEMEDNRKTRVADKVRQQQSGASSSSTRTRGATLGSSSATSQTWSSVVKGSSAASPSTSAGTTAAGSGRTDGYESPMRGTKTDSRTGTTHKRQTSGGSNGGSPVRGRGASPSRSSIQAGTVRKMQGSFIASSSSANVSSTASVKSTAATGKKTSENRTRLNSRSITTAAPKPGSLAPYNASSAPYSPAASSSGTSINRTRIARSPSISPTISAIASTFSGPNTAPLVNPTPTSRTTVPRSATSTAVHSGSVSTSSATSSPSPVASPTPSRAATSYNSATSASSSPASTSSPATVTPNKSFASAAASATKRTAATSAVSPSSKTTSSAHSAGKSSTPSSSAAAPTITVTRSPAGHASPAGASSPSSASVKRTTAATTTSSAANSTQTRARSSPGLAGSASSPSKLSTTTTTQTASRGTSPTKKATVGATSATKSREENLRAKAKSGATSPARSTSPTPATAATAAAPASTASVPTAQAAKIQLEPALIRGTRLEMRGATLVHSHGENVLVWDISTQACTHVFSLHSSTVHTVALRQNNLVVSSSNEETLVWDASNGKIIASSSEHPHGCVAMAAHPTLDQIVVAKPDGTVSLLQASTLKHLTTLDRKQIFGESTGVASHLVSSVAWVSEHLLLIASNRTIRLIDTKTLKCERTLDGINGSILHMECFNHSTPTNTASSKPDGATHVFTLDDANEVICWQLATGKVVSRMTARGGCSTLFVIDDRSSTLSTQQILPILVDPEGIAVITTKEDIVKLDPLELPFPNISLITASAPVLLL